MDTVTERVAAFRSYMKRMKAYDEACGVLYWDMRTGAPKKGIPGRSEVLSLLSTEKFKMSISAEMSDFLDYFRQPHINAEIDEVIRLSVAECAKDFERSQKIPAELYQSYVALTSEAESVWEQAKTNADFPMFQPYLERIVEYTNQFIELWGYEGHPYNALLDMYEPGITVADLDPLFAGLRERLVPLLRNIQASPAQPDFSILEGEFDKEQQKAFCLSILREIGYDLDAGRLDESSHPFATGLNLGDVRITTRYSNRDMSGALFGTIHECGHALYDQNISPELAGTVLCDGVSMGIHESQSRFWENVVGRSRSFWSRYFGSLQQAFPAAFQAVDAETFYRAINHVQPSLIRTEADELTYNLHVMVRYELEKALFDGTLAVADLPAAWNEKYKQYLGIEPPHDGVGILQDVHWSAGLFGYFPSYSLGNMYSAQLTKAMRSAIADFDELVAQGQFAPLKQWLTEHIHRHGKMVPPRVLLLQATGESLRPDALVEYLEEKYADIYRLS